MCCVSPREGRDGGITAGASQSHQLRTHTATMFSPTTPFLVATFSASVCLPRPPASVVARPGTLRFDSLAPRKITVAHATARTRIEQHLRFLVSEWVLQVMVVIERRCRCGRECVVRHLEPFHFYTFESQTKSAMQMCRSERSRTSDANVWCAPHSRHHVFPRGLTVWPGVEMVHTFD
jgi:hypothetical protein